MLISPAYAQSLGGGEGAMIMQILPIVLIFRSQFITFNSTGKAFRLYIVLNNNGSILPIDPAGSVSNECRIDNNIYSVYIQPDPFTTRIEKSLELRYLLFLPEGYKENDNKRWPLMLFLHGAGERGTNLAKAAVHGPPKIVKTRPDFPFILVSPQCPSGAGSINSCTNRSVADSRTWN